MLAQAIKDEAYRLGFDLVGITTPKPPGHLDVYRKWLETGQHAEMAYLANERAIRCRENPREILPECESIIVLGICYPASEPLPLESNQGRIASYAWGQDYHDVLPARLKALVHFIETQVGHPIPNRYYTDTGPLLERELAQRAGLGWIGKNTCLINPQIGSYFFLAEILLGLDLPSDPPFIADRCGNCTRCIDACPTVCISADPNGPRTIDAGRCISYLTIELKGSIPLELRSKMGEWVFGCDICQQVCPWNRFAGSEYPPEFGPQSGQDILDLNKTLTLTPQDFNQKYRGTPIKRTKRRGLLRNVSVAIGNQLPPDGEIALKRGTEDSELLVREHALWALDQYHGEERK